MAVPPTLVKARATTTHTPTPTVRVGRITPERTSLFICDIQESFRPLIKYYHSVIHVAKQMGQVAKIMNMPVVVTEQYPKVMGTTVPELADIVADAATHKFEKLKFSMLIPPVQQLLTDQLKPEAVIIVGIESHICVLQTVLELLEQGIDVHVLADGVSSQRSSDRVIALERMRQSGAFVTTSESIIFQLMGTKEYPGFKHILPLIKEARPDTGLAPLTTNDDTNKNDAKTLS